MLFKEFYSIKEGRIKVPTQYVYDWVDSHFDEIMSKIKETYENGYQTYVDDSLKIENEYTKETMETEVYILNSISIPNSSEDTLYALAYDKKENKIDISAKAMLEELKSPKKIKDYIKYGIIHELTHSIDPGRKFKTPNLSDFSSYINTDVEFPAFANQYLELLSHKTKEEKNKVLDAIRKGKRVPNKEVADWMSKLTIDNRRKFIKLLAKELL